MSDYLRSLIQLYKTLDESKNVLEEAINQIGVENTKQINTLPEDIQYLVEKALELTPEQRKTLLRFIESLNQE